MPEEGRSGLLHARRWTLAAAQKTAQDENVFLSRIVVG